MTQEAVEKDLVWEEARAALELAVRFAETDAMGIVHHATYVVWCEAGRVAWMDAVGMPYAEVAAGGNNLAVTGLHVEYRAPARFGERVRVVTWVTAVRSRQVSFGYEVRNAADDMLLATAVSEHICVDLEGRTAKLPAAVMERMRQGAAALAGAADRR